jgi:hypothetical protein
MGTGVLMTVQCFKMVSGEDVISNVVGESDEFFELEKPATLIIQPSQDGRMGMYSMPYMPYSDGGTIRVRKTAVASIANPDYNITNDYNQRFGSGIVIPPNRPVTI